MAGREPDAYTRDEFTAFNRPDQDESSSRVIKVQLIDCLRPPHLLTDWHLLEADGLATQTVQSMSESRIWSKFEATERRTKSHSTTEEEMRSSRTHEFVLEQLDPRCTSTILR